MSPKITFIGGGSYQWGPKLLLDLANTASLRDAEVALHDINIQPLPKMLQLVDRVRESRGLRWRASATGDRRTALAGADFVIVCISTGALTSMAVDIEVPEKYGLRQSVGDSVGPGGINRALRNIPVMVGIARDMEELCPDAWLLNLTNPMTTLTRSVLAATEIEAVGLCHEVTGVQFQLSMLLGCDFREMQLDVCGVNHLPLITSLHIGGVDGLELLADKLEDLDGFGEETLSLPNMFGAHEIASSGGEWTKAGLLDQHRVKLELFRRFGVLPAAGDRHLVEFFPNFLTETSGWGERWGVDLTTIATREESQRGYVHELDELLVASEIPRTPSGEMVAALIDSRVRDKAREFPLNVGNVGQVGDLPYDAVVESMCDVDGRGVHPRGEVFAPPLLAEYLRRISASQEMVVEAALSGDRQLVFEAMLADPLASTLDYDALWGMTNELIDATMQWLPQFV